MKTYRVVCVGNLKDSFNKQAVEEYSKRLQKFCNLKIIELPEKNNLENIELIKEKEGEQILACLEGYTILLDRQGEEFSSESLAKFLEKQEQNASTFTFVIGGSYGVSEAVKAKANKLISFSKLTFPHGMFRVMLLEQLYRKECIVNNISYHK